MCDKGRSVNLSVGYQAKNFGTIAAVHASSLEREVLTIHVRQREHLRTVVKGHHGNNRIRTGTLPSQAESVIGTSHFDDYIRSAMRTLLTDKILALLRRNNLHVGVMGAHEAGPFFRLFAHDDAAGTLQADAKQGADARRASTDNKYRVI